jgi:hypothetical protein
VRSEGLCRWKIPGKSFIVTENRLDSDYIAEKFNFPIKVWCMDTTEFGVWMQQSLVYGYNRVWCMDATEFGVWMQQSLVYGYNRVWCMDTTEFGVRMQQSL